MTNDTKFFIGASLMLITLMAIACITLYNAEDANNKYVSDTRQWQSIQKELDSVCANMPVTHTVQWVQLRNGQKYAVLNGVAYMHYDAVWLDGKQLPRKYKYEPTQQNVLVDSIYIARQKNITAHQASEIARIRLEMTLKMSKLQARVDSLEKYELIHKHIPWVLFM